MEMEWQSGKEAAVHRQFHHAFHYHYITTRKKCRWSTNRRNDVTGWRWLNQHYCRGWNAFRAFWLDPALDPEPAHPSGRQAAVLKPQWHLVLQC